MSRGFSPAAFAGFSLVFRPWMRRRLGGIHLTGLAPAPATGIPIVLVANHTSWWDAFLLWEIRRSIRPGAPMHTLMLASELRGSPFLARIGAIGFDPSAAASFGHAVKEIESRVETRPDSFVFFFPQGRLYPSFRRPLGFRRGVELLARRLPTAAIIPVGLHLEPMTGPAPHAWISAAPAIPASDAPTAGRLEAEVEAELDALLNFLSIHGEDSPARWPGPEGVLPRAPAACREGRRDDDRLRLEPRLPTDPGRGTSPSDLPFSPRSTRPW